MIYTYTLTPRQDAIMQAKALASSTKDKTETPQSLLDFKVAEYIEACSRDVKLDVDSKIAAKLVTADAARKAEVLAQLEAA